MNAVSQQGKSSKQSNLRIGVIGSTFPRFHDDPQVPWLRETVKRLSARGHNVTVIASSFEGLKTHYIDGICVKRFRYAPASIENLTHDEGAPSKLKNPLLKLLAIPYIISGIIMTLYWARTHRFDVINVHWPFPHGLFTILPRILFGIPVVATCHGAGMAMARKSTIIARVLRFAMKHTDLVISNSSHTQAEVKRLTGYDSEILTYGATVAVREAKPPLSDTGPVKLLFTGRLIQRKGVHYLLRALPSVLKERNITLYITGDGDYRSEWEQLATELELNDVVQFLGFVSNERLAELYEQCDVYVLPAIFDDNGDTEGLGVVLIEALQYARPVIASRVGGIVDVVRHEETGLLVPEKDEDALTTAILRLLSDPNYARELGEAGRRFAGQQFDWDRIIDANQKLFYMATGYSSKGPVEYEVVSEVFRQEAEVVQ